MVVKNVTVQQGETLMDIARREYKDPGRWLEIVAENGKDPGIAAHFYVREGTVLKLSNVEDKPFDPSANA